MRSLQSILFLSIKFNKFIKFYLILLIGFSILYVPLCAQNPIYNDQWQEGEEYYSVPEAVADPIFTEMMEGMRAHQTQYQMFLFYTINVDTPGFIEQGSYNFRGPNGHIVNKTYHRWRSGPVIETNNDLDFYLDSNSRGMYAVQFPTTVAYTRNGRFRIDSSGRLVTHQNSYPIINALGGGAIVIPQGADVTVSVSGMVYADSDPVGKIKTLIFSNEGLLQLVSLNGVFFVSQNKGIEPETLPGGELNYRVRQGYIEENNVLKAIVGDVGMLKRSYTATAKAAKVYGRMMSTATQMVGN